jgi:hypothetical protein
MRFAQVALALVAGMFLLSLRAEAHAPSGAIFTTVADGSEVNFNHYPNKQAVYLDGGPGPGAPATAAGLDDGTYVFQVTDPPGKVLLSTDPARCRQFIVVGGIINAVVVNDCHHVTGVDVDHGAVTVQLFPYNDTPNPGGVYKAWAVRVEDFLAGCAALGVADGLNVVDCGRNAGNFHGFVPAHSKTDNFKVKDTPIVEIDTRFFIDLNGDGRRNSCCESFIDGLGITWYDPIGASNKKWSYLNRDLNVNHEAHVEAVETGFHEIEVPSQVGCTVRTVAVAGEIQDFGPQTVSVHIKSLGKPLTVFVDVGCVDEQSTP